MEDKLKSLTESLYKDGLRKGQNEADELVAKAKKHAEKIVEEATAKAKMIVATAEKEAADKIKKVDSELALSAKQVITKIRNEVSGLISLNNLNDSTSKAFDNDDFLRELILKIVESWDKGSSTTFDLRLSIPKEYEQKVEGFVRHHCQRQLEKGLEVNFIDSDQKGVKIGPKDSSYQIDFSADSFTNFFNEYLKPLTREILFASETDLKNGQA